jgi:hypothetical protein
VPTVGIEPAGEVDRAEQAVGAQGLDRARLVKRGISDKIERLAFGLERDGGWIIEIIADMQDAAVGFRIECA